MPYNDTVEPRSGREENPAEGQRTFTKLGTVRALYQGCGDQMRQWFELQKRPYSVRDQQRLLYNAAFARVGELDQLLLRSGVNTGAPLTELGRLRDNVTLLNNDFGKFLQLRKMEKDAPFKAFLNLLLSPSRDTHQSHILREYVLRGAAALAATSGSQYIVSVGLSQVINGLPKSVQDSIVKEILGEDASKSPKALSEALSRVPEHTLSKLDDMISRKMAEELSASGDLTDRGRECLSRIVSEIERLSHPPSTFLNEVKAEPWQSYAIQGTAAGVNQSATSYYNTDTPARRSAKAAAWTLALGSTVHLLSRAAQGNLSTGLKELFWNAIFSALNAYIEPQLVDQLKQHLNSENELRAAKIIGLAISRFSLKNIKMICALEANGGKIDSLGGTGLALVRNAGVTILPTLIKGALDAGLDRWYEHSKDRADDFRFSTHVRKATEAVDDLIAALENKLANERIEQEQGEAFEQALEILRDCKRVKEGADNWNPSPEALSLEDLSNAFNASLDIYTAAPGSINHSASLNRESADAPFAPSEFGSNERL